jgi:mannan endo-1,4-beta-mannosidase
MTRYSTKAVLVLITLLLSIPGIAGMQIRDGKLLDNNGDAFIMRGVNHAHTWYVDRTEAYRDIAATGANTVRVVLSNGQRQHWQRNNGAEVADIIKLGKDNKLIIILEVHDATGWSEDGEAAHISTAVDYWLSEDIFPVIQGQEDYAVINIANEPFANNIEPEVYINDNITAVKRLRDAGIRHLLMVDAANYGQDWQHILRDNAKIIAAADPLNNIVFSIHMYEVFKASDAVKNYLQAFADMNLPLVVGEFGADHRGQEVDEDAVMAMAEQYGVGYLGWSWSGNGDCCTSLDMVIDFDPDNLSPWGDRLINGENGIRKTSKIAGIYRDSWWRSFKRWWKN